MCFGRLLIVLHITYAPIAGAVLRIFMCRQACAHSAHPSLAASSPPAHGPDSLAGIARRNAENIPSPATVRIRSSATSHIAALSCFLRLQVEGVWVLVQDATEQCYTPQHTLQMRLAAFWLAFFVAGVPSLFAGLLVLYGVPRARLSPRRCLRCPSPTTGSLAEAQSPEPCTQRQLR